jgi:dTMP kinase
MPKNVFFITFEGTDGVGKSTQARLSAEWLNRRKIPVTLTREPGGGPLAERVRALLLDPKNDMQPLTELLLYQAARVEHLHRVSLPALKRGISVLCDRFTDATLAYQGHARGLMRESLVLNKLVCGKFKPDLTLLFDLPAKHGLTKARARKKSV